MRRRARPSPLLALVVARALAPAVGCSRSQAHVDWRPGLSELDFDGVFEISAAELETFAREAEGNTRFSRFGAGANADAEPRMAALGQRLAGEAGSTDPRGYAIVELGGDGRVVLLGDRGQDYAGAVDWFAETDDGEHAALVSGSKLAVASGGASTGVDVGSLLGRSLAGHRLLLLVRDGELSVFALPELGGVVVANEPGYLFAFRHQPGARTLWDISVARIVVTL